jgi:hypothetical protein
LSVKIKKNTFYTEEQKDKLNELAIGVLSEPGLHAKTSLCKNFENCIYFEIRKFLFHFVEPHKFEFMIFPERHHLIHVYEHFKIKIPANFYDLSIDTISHFDNLNQNYEDFKKTPIMDDCSQTEMPLLEP